MRAPPKVSERQLTGESYRHPSGWRLWIPESMERPCPAFAGYWPNGRQRSQRTELRIGQRTFYLDHQRKTIEGDVPASWLVNLNAGGVEPDAVDMFQAAA